VICLERIAASFKKKEAHTLYFMEFADRKVAGTLLFVGVAQFIICLVIAEILHSNYNVSTNYISDLGVGDSAIIFNSSIFLLGLVIVASAYFIQRAYNSKLTLIMLIMTGIGAMGVGLFTEDTHQIHIAFSLVVFLFGGLSAIVCYKLQKPPLSYISVILGAATLVALALFGSENYLGLGPGGMERMIAYPVLLWAIGFGGHLIGYQEESRKVSKL
jgi:hypothetical membrane protein